MRSGRTLKRAGNGGVLPFTKYEKQGLYRAIYERRDIRREFLPDTIPDEVLLKILDASHHAGSVGFMQPWNFVVIRDPEVRKKVKAIFEIENQAAARLYRGKKKLKYISLKLEGILDAPVNVCVTCNHSRGGRHVLGRNTIRETDLFSTCCAIQNLWLAARAEEIGIGWVSILKPRAVKKVLGIPKNVSIVGYLCLGYVQQFPAKPMLETEGWEKRIAVESLIFRDRWDRRYFEP